MSTSPANLKIFVEGPDDSTFIKACIYQWFQVKISSSDASKDSSNVEGIVIELGGFSKHIMDFGKSTPLLARIIKSQQSSKIPWANIFIFDADDEIKDVKNGGFEKRKAYIQEQARNEGFSIADEELFLLPYNAKYRTSTGDIIHDGDLESLLTRVTAIPQIIECWDNYADCIKPYIQDNHTLSRKSKIFSYAEALTGFDSAGGRERKYLNTHHWNLDPTSQYLQPLHAFLKPYFDFTSNIPTP
jgi:hypothetical protein